MRPGTLWVTGDDAADDLLNTSGTALMIGMLLDQQIPIEWAFRGPATLAERLGHLDASTIAGLDVDAFVAVCCEKPAVHRFPASMGKRMHALCAVLEAEYEGDGANVWRGVADAADLKRRLLALPGFGPQKTAIFVAMLAKRFGVTPDGWERVAGDYADTEPRSVADLDSPEALAALRARRAAAKAKSKPAKPAK